MYHSSGEPTSTKMSPYALEKFADRTIKELKQRSKDALVNVILKMTPKMADELEPEAHASHQQALEEGAS